MLPLPTRPSEAVSLAIAGGVGAVHFQFEYSLADAQELKQAATSLARHGLRSILTMHSFDARASLANRLIREGFPHIIVTSDALRASMIRHGLNPAGLHVIPLNVKHFKLPDRRSARAELGLEREPAVGYFGFIYAHKGLENLALAARELRRTYPNLRCFLFTSLGENEGSRSAYERMRAFYDAHGLWDEVDLRMGYVDEAEVVRHLHAMDLNVLPYAELPGVQTSAAVRTLLAAGRPIVVTDTAHFADLGSEVHRIPDHSPTSIAAGIRAVLENPSYQVRLLERAARYANGHRTKDMALRHLSLYRRLRLWSPVRVPPRSRRRTQRQPD